MFGSDNNDKATRPNRRQVINKIWALIGIAALAEFFWLGVTILNSRREQNHQTATEDIVTAGSVELFLPETVTAIPNGQFYLACLKDGSLLALSRTCTHLGCSVPWNEDEHKFICPCHGSTFDLTGEVLTSPAPRPLDTYPVRIENGIVKVNISTPIKRERFKKEQATRI